MRDNTLDLVDIFEVISEYKKSQSKLIFFVNFTGILFTYLSFEPIENFDENWDSEIGNGGKMTEGTAKGIIYRNRNLTKKYRDEVEASSLPDKPELICNDIENQILRYTNKKGLHKELTKKISEDKSISKSNKSKMLEEPELNMFLARILIYEVLNGYEVKRATSKMAKSKEKSIVNEGFKNINYSVSIDTQDISENQVDIPENEQKSNKDEPKTLVFLPEREKDNLFGEKKGYLNRPTYTIQKPANHITFNSIINNESYGDERNFTVAKLVSERSDTWRNSIHVTADDEYIVKIYVHNNAAENLKLVAENTRVVASIPNTAGTKIKIQGQLKADNSIPKDIWNSVIFKSDKRFNIIFVQGSARYYNNINPSTGFNLSDDIATSKGALLGYEQMDGKVPGCNQYSGIVTFKVKAQVQKQANFTLNKQVRKFGEKNWQKSITALPNETLEYLISYSNTGEIPMKDIVVKDVLSGGMKYIDGSAKIANSFNPNGITITSDEIVGKGINIGNYEIGANAFVTYSVKIAESKEFTHAPSSLMSKTQVFTKYGSKSDTVNIEVSLGNDI